MAMTYRAPASTAGLLSTNDRNRVLNNFAGGLLTGFQVSPTPVDGRYLAMTNTPFVVVDPVLDQLGPMTMDDLARLMEEYRNQQNLLNEGGAMDDFAPSDGPFGPGGFGPAEAEPPSMQVSSLGEALGNMYSGFTDAQGQKQAGFKDLVAMSPYGRMASTIQGLLGVNAPVGARSFQEGFEYSGYDESQDERDAAFDADMQDEE